MEKARHRFSLSIPITRQEITEAVLAALGFFVGRVVLFGIVNPIGIAYISSFFMKGRAFYISSLFTALGILTRYNHFYSFKYLICIATLTIMQFLFSKRVRAIGEFTQITLVSSVLFTSGAVVAIVNNGSLYLGVIAALESVLTFTLGVMFGRAMICVKGRNRLLQRSLSNEELVSVAILIGAVVSGCSDIFIGAFSFRYYFCFTLVMLMSQGGSALGAACGIVLGSLIHISGYEPESFIIILSMSGLVCGSLRNSNKLLMSAGFLISIVIASLYFKYSIFESEHIVSFAAATVSFFFLQSEFLSRLPAVTNPVSETQNAQYSVKAREIVTYRLNSYSYAFAKLSSSFTKLAERKKSLSKEDLSRIIDDATSRVCYDCPKNEICWGSGLYDTCRSVYAILSILEANGKIPAEEIPPTFKEQCKDYQYFTATINRCFELYRANLSWRNKLAESRKLIAEQITSVSDIFRTLSCELDAELNFIEKLEKSILSEFDKSKISVDSVIVLQNLQNLQEVIVNHKPCGGCHLCDKTLIPIINEVTGKAMRRSDPLEKCPAALGKGVCHLRFIEERPYTITYSVAHASKADSPDSVSGDSHTFMDYGNHCLLALSDGMGSGKRAKEESSAAIELLEEFIESGFDKATSVRLINSVLLLRGVDDSFSTLDICTVNLRTGNADFIKIGAASTFIIRNGSIDVIRSWSLPAGIVDTVEADSARRKLYDNDIIVMVTDGVLDSDPFHTEKESWIINALQDFNAKNPRDIADYLLAQSLENYKSSPNDDMTVLAAKIWKKKKD